MVDGKVSVGVIDVIAGTVLKQDIDKIVCVDEACIAENMNFYRVIVRPWI